MNEIVVKIIKNWSDPDLFRQLPMAGGNRWENVFFTSDPMAESDYVIVLNYIPKEIEVVKAKREVWAFMQEPYVEGMNDWVERGHEAFYRVYTHHLFSEDKKYIATQTCLPWHVDKSYDELVGMRVPVKSRMLSWIVSDLKRLQGHRLRMEFYYKIKKYKLDIDVFGRGINPIDDKFDGLAPYRYSLAIENSSTPHYWTEKLADCFLSFTVPIYFGCINLSDYFPEKSFIQIDLSNQEKSIEMIEDVVKNDCWEARLEALQEARDLVLNSYQLFPFLVNEIAEVR